MPDLGDFLGTLLGELAVARLHADVETLRIADIYANHELLKHLPVPRFRLPEVRIDLPAIIEAGAAASPKPVDVKKTTATILERVRRKLEERDVALTRTEDARLAKIIGRILEESLGARPPAAAQTIAERVVSELRAASQRIAGTEHHQMLQELKAEIVRGVVISRAAAARISILPHTGAVREIPDADRLIRLHLVISEEAVEWTVLDTAGGTKERLVQE